MEAPSTVAVPPANDSDDIPPFRSSENSPRVPFKASSIAISISSSRIVPILYG